MRLLIVSTFGFKLGSWLLPIAGHDVPPGGPGVQQIRARRAILRLIICWRPASSAIMDVLRNHRACRSVHLTITESAFGATSLASSVGSRLGRGIADRLPGSVLVRLAQAGAVETRGLARRSILQACQSAVIASALRQRSGSARDPSMMTRSPHARDVALAPAVRTRRVQLW